MNLDSIPPARRRTCTYCHGWVDSTSPETFRLVQGWARWRHRNTIAFIQDLDTYLCTTCHDELAKPSLTYKQPRLFTIASDGAIDPPASGNCQDCGIPLWATNEETYLLLRGWLRAAKLRLNTTSHGIRNNTLAYVTVLGPYMCRECFKRKKAGIPVGQMTLWADK